MSAQQKLADALARLETIAERTEREFAEQVQAEIDWEFKTGDVFVDAKAAKKSDAWAEKLAIREFFDVWERYARARSAVKSSERLAKLLTTIVDGYRTQNANERTVTG